MRRAAALALALLAACAPREDVRVGSKKFTESVILGELAAQLVEASGAAALHRRELGGTRILWSALRAGDIDAYVEYTGTLREELLAGEQLAPGEAALRARVEREGLRMSRPIGFDNSYALGMLPERARELGIRAISDLREHPELRLGFGNEFLDRGDGWPALRERYRLPQADVRGLDHDLAYRALVEAGIDVTDFYATDAEIAHHGLLVLEDDLGHFPEYQAVVLWRADLEPRAPAAAAALRRMEGLLDADAMRALNARARIERVGEARVAADLLAARVGLEAVVLEHGLWTRIGQRTLEHLTLVGAALAGAIALAVPLGILAARRPRLGQLVLLGAGVVQTIPSLALLVLMIPLLGIGARPAIAALFLYGLLPILRNTVAGLQGIPRELRESAEALGLPPGAILRRVELPLASPSILAGIQTAAVIAVGTATLGALIGAGGYGQPILTGIRLDDTALLLEGALPAAGLALAAQGLFELLERALVPRGLRLRPVE